MIMAGIAWGWRVDRRMLHTVCPRSSSQQNWASSSLQLRLCASDLPCFSCHIGCRGLLPSPQKTVRTPAAALLCSWACSHTGLAVSGFCLSVHSSNHLSESTPQSGTSNLSLRVSMSHSWLGAWHLTISCGMNLLLFDLQPFLPISCHSVFSHSVSSQVTLDLSPVEKIHIVFPTHTLSSFSSVSPASNGSLV